MAATLTSFLLAKGRGNTTGLAAVDGVTDARIRLVNTTYLPGHAVYGPENACREVVVVYTPPAGAVPKESIIDWRAQLDDYVTVRWTYGAEGSTQTVTYPAMKVKDIVLIKSGADVDTWQILLREDKEDIDLNV